MPRSKLTERFQNLFTSGTQQCCVCKQAKEADDFPDSEIHIEALGKQDICEHCYHTIKDQRILHTS
ncbi:MAG: hypothetical protein SVU32_04540 [Candidatus Nanohaloarchaea archaeon]|nr:hypothetical protein [Candidatus Nanohaloarchaea archaeon]